MNSSGHQAPEGGQCAVTTIIPRRTRHTKRDALQRMQALGAPDRSVGACVYRLRCAGITDSGIGRLLGFPGSVESESLRRTMNRWEQDEGLRTEIDSQARADVTHTEKRVSDACRRMCKAMPDDADLVYFTLEAALDSKAAASVLDYLRELVCLLEAEMRANVLHLPRNVMPGARPVAWSEIRERIAALQAGLDDAKRREIVADYIASEQCRQQVLAELSRHPAAEQILELITGDSDTPASGDALGHLPVALDVVLAIRDAQEGQEGAESPHRKRRRFWPDREHINHERYDARLILEQRVGDLRIAARWKAADRL
jgi:hypothetical protein